MQPIYEVIEAANFNRENNLVSDAVRLSEMTIQVVEAESVPACTCVLTRILDGVSVAELEGAKIVLARFLGYSVAAGLVSKETEVERAYLIQAISHIEEKIRNEKDWKENTIENLAA